MSSGTSDGSQANIQSRGYSYMRNMLEYTDTKAQGYGVHHRTIPGQLRKKFRLTKFLYMGPQGGWKRTCLEQQNQGVV